MTSTTGPLYKLLGVIVSIATFFAIILTAVRLLLTSVWVNVEYRMPGFPEDPFGFSMEERIKWATYSLDYLLNDQGVEYFNNARFSDGVKIYEHRELQHLVDVKDVVSNALLLWYFSLIFIVLTGVMSMVGKFGDLFRRSLRRGALLTIGFVVGVSVVVLLAFGVFFVFFHEIFFAPGTWTFSYADTLIRLFPERFWQDAFLWIAAISVLISLWLSSMTKETKKKAPVKKRA